MTSASGKERTNISSRLTWEPLRGYSRAVQVGDQLFISGTTAVNEDGRVVGADDAYTQTMFIIQTIREVLRSAGFQITDVVRTRLFVTDLSRWKQYAQAHRQVFEKIRPASSIVEVSALIDPRMLVEMEAEAVRGCRLVDTKAITIAAQAEGKDELKD